MIINNIKEKLKEALQSCDDKLKLDVLKELNDILKSTSDDTIMNELKTEILLLLDDISKTINISIVRTNKSSGVKYIYLPKNIDIKDNELCIIKKIKYGEK